ncbi:MAG: RecX family transcriptional regulator [Muribaculaceae bacterium]|nr:RecX family transcriptional regulator [Muribaculaceae bacterium]
MINDRDNDTDRSIDIDKLRLRMADLCARSEQCSYDIALKLRRAGASAAQMMQIIDDLRSQKFIDDARYARALTNDKVRFAGWGRMKIRAALLAKRISESDIRLAFDGIDDDEYNASLMRVARSKARGLDLGDYRQRQKFFRSMASRGYEPGLISSALTALCSDC